jgi:hypothetical protein
MKNFRLLVLSVALMSFFSACVPAPLLLVGAAGGAAGGTVYSKTNGTIKDIFNISKEQAFETFVGLINNDQGVVIVSSIADGNIEAKVGKSLLFIAIKPVNDMSIEVEIKAKKYNELIPDNDTAVRYYRTFIKEVTK